MSRIFAKVFEHANFRGQHRWIREDVRDFVHDIGFNDKVSSVLVYKGNEYREGDTIRFHQHVGFDGGYLELGPGSYPNIHIQPFSFGDKISSADVTPPHLSRGLNVRLMIRVYEHVNYRGEYRDILSSESNLIDLGLNNAVSSIRVFPGEDYEPGWVCDFYQDAGYSGGTLPPGRFTPGTNLPNIAEPPYSFNDVISSVRIYRLT